MSAYLYIGVGELNCFFTLREAYVHTFIVEGNVCEETRSYHLRNLSQNPAEAVAKAQEAADAAGVEMRSTVDSLAEELNRIHRATEDELKAREQARLDREARWEEERLERELMYKEVIAAGRFAFGKYKGVDFVDAPLGYLIWLVQTMPEFEEHSLMRFTAEAVAAVPGLVPALPTATPDVYIGEPKQRRDFDVTVLAGFHFYRDSFSGYGSEVVYISKMVEKETGALLTVMSTAWNVEGREGEALKIKATVKEHSEFKGEAQTVVQRVKEVV